jgi:hypothetical protein
MSSGNFFKSDLFPLHNIIQASMLVYPKEIIISTLKDFFSKDSYYHYSKDQWGFANTTDHTDLPPGANLPSGFGAQPSLNNTLNLSTRVFIGENYRYDGIYYPAILVKSGGSRYVPISINRDQSGIQYESMIFEDGYGNQKVIHKPKYFITAGAWEGSIIIDVMTRSLRSRDDLSELIAMCFTEINFDTLVDVGVIVKPINISAPSETDDRNDKLFRQTLTLDIRTEWRREIPVDSVVDTILFTINFANLSNPNSPPAANLTINTSVSITDLLLEL